MVVGYFSLPTAVPTNSSVPLIIWTRLSVVWRWEQEVKEGTQPPKKLRMPPMGIEADGLLLFCPKVSQWLIIGPFSNCGYLIKHSGFHIS